MIEKLITIITPTYNRAELLTRVYRSLECQSIKCFKWIVIDDGSTDKTRDIINDIINKSSFDIYYKRKDNGGKHTAINLGMSYVDTPLVFILDSDDYLDPDAMNSIGLVHQSYSRDSRIAGYTFLKSDSNGKLLGSRFPIEGRYDYIKTRINQKVKGEYCDVFKSEILKNYPFSEYKGERYIGESTVWIRIGQKYDMVAVNKIIYIADYQIGGLTNQGRLLRMNNPRGTMEYANLCMSKGMKFTRKIKAGILFSATAFSMNKRLIHQISGCNNKFVFIFTLPLGFLVNKYWERMIRERE